MTAILAGHALLHAQVPANPQPNPHQDAVQSDSAARAPNEEQDSVPTPLPRGKKLVLTNGTFQLVREYHREGDRVRYYSVERSVWEEIPVSLVDWQATQKAEAEQEAQQKALVEKSRAVAAAALSASLDVDKSLPVRSGIFLPDDEGLFVVDGDRVVAMEQEEISSHVSKGRTLARILTGIPLISTKHHIEVEGKHAKLRIHSGEPEFYFRPYGGREPRISLVRAEVKGKKRALLAISTNVAGIQSREADEVPLLVWDAARGVYRFTVEEVLQPGEYALAETTEEGLAGFVWTFGVDAAPGTH